MIKTVGRNDPCPCHSKKKYKKCHGGPRPPRLIPMYAVNPEDPNFSTIIEDPSRSCGDCQACCESMRIDTLDKPTHTVCDHQCRSGCRIYNARPDDCAGYSCWWRAGWGLDRDRPDDLGIIVDTALNGDLEGWRDIPAIVLREVRPGVLELAGIYRDGLISTSAPVVDNRIAAIVKEYYNLDRVVMFHTWGRDELSDMYAPPMAREVLRLRGIIP